MATTLLNCDRMCDLSAAALLCRLALHLSCSLKNCWQMTLNFNQQHGSSRSIYLLIVFPWRILQQLSDVNAVSQWPIVASQSLCPTIQTHKQQLNAKNTEHTITSGFKHDLQRSPVRCTAKPRFSWSRTEAWLRFPPAKGRKMMALIPKKNESLQREFIKMCFLVHFLMFHCNVQTAQRLQRLQVLKLLSTPNSHKWVHSCINWLSEVKMNIYYVCTAWNTWTGLSWDAVSPTAKNKTQQWSIFVILAR